MSRLNCVANSRRPRSGSLERTSASLRLYCGSNWASWYASVGNKSAAFCNSWTSRSKEKRRLPRIPIFRAPRPLRDGTCNGCLPQTATPLSQKIRPLLASSLPIQALIFSKTSLRVPWKQDSICLVRLMESKLASLAKGSLSISLSFLSSYETSALCRCDERGKREDTY